jgi:fido (protein-threonine AMPylation protein)
MINNYVLFSVARVNDSYDLKTDVELILGEDPSRLAKLEENELWQLIKKCYLSESIHKGKFLGFMNEKSQSWTLQQVLQFCKTITKKCVVRCPVMRIQIEYSESTIEELLIALKEKRDNLVIEQDRNKHLLEEVINRYARDFTFSSNEMEGNSMTIEQVDFILEEPINAETSEHFETLSHYYFVKEIIVSKPSIRDLTEDVIRNYHKTLEIQHLTAEREGTYRKKELVRGGLRDFCKASDIPRAMKEFCEWAASVELNEENAFEIAAQIHYRFVNIHPFANGSGRMSRILMNIVLMQFGYPPVSILPSIKEIYFEALDKIDKGKGNDLLVRIVAEACLRSLDISLALFK